MRGKKKEEKERKKKKPQLQNTPCFILQTGPFVISSYFSFGSYELHENFQKYIEEVACCEYGINILESLTSLC